MKKNDPVILAWLTALAVTIFVVESLIPKPLPFLKLGLANAIVLILIWQKNYLPALLVLVCKTLIGGMFSGMLLSPSTLISAGASVTAYLAMLLAVSSRCGFSIMGVSICGAAAHNVMQLFIVNIILIKSSALYKIMPIMLLLAIATGSITGYLAHLLQQKNLIPALKK